MKYLHKSIIIFLSVLAVPAFLQAQYQVEDVFGRNIVSTGIVLTDWEGYMANPAISFTVAPNGGSQTITLTANHARLYFDMPSTAGAAGPSKTVTASAGNPQTVYLSIFPDRDGSNETYSLTLTSGAGTLNVPIMVMDQDDPGRSPDFSIPLDFSQDNPTYNFFGNAARVSTVTEAAGDWAYFLADQGFDQVATGQEQTYIWGDNYASGYWTINTQSYTGFLIYPHGFNHDDNRSGGAPSIHAFQTIGGSPTLLRRSGAYEAEKDGNYNTLGWLNSLSDHQWYLATNLGAVQNDLYSIALHEMGHALVFNPAHTQFGDYKTQGYVDESNVVAYYGSTLPVNTFDHFDDGTLLVDPASKRGVFGSEYANVMPLGRWLITKLNLLALQAVGYSLRDVSCFAPLSTTSETLPNGTQNSAYSASFAAQGGLKSYQWTILSGTLPAGLTLNSFTGQISGVPTQVGAFPLEIELLDNENNVIVFNTTLTITGALPVELLSGPNATVRGNTQTEITWTTASEKQTAYFLVERSTDLQHFSVLSKVTAAGNSSQSRYYQVLDENPANGTNYYRIRMVDTDGSEVLSRTVSATISSGGYQIGPNPAQSFFGIQAFGQETFDYSLYDITGRLVRAGTAGNYVQMETASLPNGAYRLHLTRSGRDVTVFPILVAH